MDRNPLDQVVEVFTDSTARELTGRLGVWPCQGGLKYHSMIHEDTNLSCTFRFNSIASMLDDVSNDKSESVQNFRILGVF